MPWRPPQQRASGWASSLAAEPRKICMSSPRCSAKATIIQHSVHMTKWPRMLAARAKCPLWEKVRELQLEQSYEPGALVCGASIASRMRDSTWCLQSAAASALSSVHGQGVGICMGKLAARLVWTLQGRPNTRPAASPKKHT